MSEFACLELVNGYAAARNCSLNSGPATTPGSNAQCTERFPGSRGTCHNATVLSDAEVMELLAGMAAGH
jgi:hypothetical protein